MTNNPDADISSVNEAAQEPKKSRSILATLRGMFFTLMVLTVIWVGLRYVLLPVFSNGRGSVDQSLPTDVITPKLQALDARITALENQPLPPQIVVDTTPLEARIAALEQAKLQVLAHGDAVQTEASPQVVESVAPLPIPNEELSALRADVEALKSLNHQAIRRVLLISQLQRSIEEGRPFAQDMQALVAHDATFKEMLAPVESYAELGVPSMKSLQEEFVKVVNELFSHQKTNGRFIDNLKSLITIRKAGDQHKGADDQSVIARAEVQVNQGNIAAALAEIEKLSSERLSTFEAWRAHASAHVSAEAVRSALARAMAGEGTP